MNAERLRSLIDDIASDFNEQVIERLGERLATFMYLGSYAQGRVSLERPDVNYVVIWKERGTAEDYLTLGDILSSLIAKYLDRVVIRPEFRPYKFSYPAARKEHDVFLNVSCFNMADRTRSFFLPDYVLDGFKHSRRMIFGDDVFEDMTFDVTKHGILSAAAQKLASHKVQLDRVPLVYDVAREHDLIFNESVDHGKNLAYFGVEVAMSEEEILAKDYLRVIADKAELEACYQERFDHEAVGALKTILEAREHYTEWKNSRERAEAVYKAAFTLHNKVMRMAMAQLKG